MENGDIAQGEGWIWKWDVSSIILDYINFFPPFPNCRFFAARIGRVWAATTLRLAPPFWTRWDRVIQWRSKHELFKGPRHSSIYIILYIYTCCSYTYMYIYICILCMHTHSGIIYIYISQVKLWYRVEDLQKLWTPCVTFREARSKEVGQRRWVPWSLPENRQETLVSCRSE